MYRTMTAKEKINYFYHRVKVLLFATLFTTIGFVFTKLILKEENYSSIILFILIMLLIALLICMITNLFFPVNLFSKKVQITDGYIDERKQYQFSDSLTDYYKGTARTLDGSKSTPMRSIPECFAFGKPPVKIIVYNNIAVDFFFTKESDNYLAEHHQKWNKKQIISLMLMGLIVVAWIVVMLVFL